MIGNLFNLIVGFVVDPHSYVGILVGAAIGWAGLKRFYAQAKQAVTDVASKV